MSYTDNFRVLQTCTALASTIVLSLSINSHSHASAIDRAALCFVISDVQATALGNIGKFDEAKLFERDQNTFYDTLNSTLGVDRGRQAAVLAHTRFKEQVGSLSRLEQREIFERLSKECKKMARDIRAM